MCLFSLPIQNLNSRRNVMQLFSFFQKIILKMLPMKTLKNFPQKYKTLRPSPKFQYCQPAQNQPKSHILSHKNGSPWDLYIMTLKLSLKDFYAFLRQYFPFFHLIYGHTNGKEFYRNFPA